MIKIRKSAERGYFDYGWLQTRHTFAFGEYRDPDYMGFRKLRVINEDFVAAGQGFGTHPHRDMEILTYVLEGAVAHKDSMGNGSVIKPGDVQRMTAGTGVTHSESNPSLTETLRLLQIWILPDQNGLEPGYEQKNFPRKEKLNRLCLVASCHSKNGVVKIHQNVELFISVLEQGKTIEHTLDKGRHAWIQVASGSIKINNVSLNQGDGAAISEEKLLTITAMSPSEILFFDLV